MIGIYKIVNIQNNKVYIGQSINVEKRILAHKEELNRNVHGNEHLQRAWNKYGKENFEFLIIEECTQEKLTEREQYWIDYYGGINSEYNYNQREASSHGLHSEETKQKISNKQRGVKKKPGRKVSQEGRKILSMSHMGIKPTKETRLKMSKAHKNYRVTEETRQKISNTNKQRFLDNTQLAKNISNRMKNRSVSEETKEKLRVANLGKKYGEETSKKHSESLKEAYKTGKRKTVTITVDGITKTQTEWANLLNISHTYLIYQRKKGVGYVEDYIRKLLKLRNN